MLTCGLSEESKNDLIVELEERRGERWACLLLEYTNVKEENLVDLMDPANLIDPLIPSLENLVKMQLPLARFDDFLVAGDLFQARIKLVQALTYYPSAGKLLQHMSDLSRKSGDSSRSVVKHLRRAVANTDGTLGDLERAFKARTSYSSALGKLGDLAGEQLQLEILIDQCPKMPMMGNWMPTLLIRYADSFCESRNFNRTLEVLQKLDKLPRPFSTIYWDVQEHLGRISQLLCTHWYKEGRELEVRSGRMADPRELLEGALARYQRSCEALKDADSVAACERVVHKLSIVNARY
ncbi:hypothetical protein B484DRAFT_420879 [Ochromonadaceae sp. CCMP2298]|nr:hypothetical protein B484DRAFT_420879 [Ochromonadaceae sp. CCMP2298]